MRCEVGAVVEFRHSRSCNILSAALLGALCAVESRLKFCLSFLSFFMFASKKLCFFKE